jgi:hypothetical protein
MVKKFEFDLLDDDFEKRITIIGADPQLDINPRLDGEGFNIEIDKWLRNMMLHAANFTEKAHSDKESAIESLDAIRFCSVALLEFYKEKYNIAPTK